MRFSDLREYTPGTLTDLHNAWLPHPVVGLQNVKEKKKLKKKAMLPSIFGIALYVWDIFWHLEDSRHGNLPRMTVNSGGDLGAGR